MPFIFLTGFLHHHYQIISLRSSEFYLTLRWFYDISFTFRMLFRFKMWLFFSLNTATFVWFAKTSGNFSLSCLSAVSRVAPAGERGQNFTDKSRCSLSAPSDRRREVFPQSRSWDTPQLSSNSPQCPTSCHAGTVTHFGSLVHFRAPLCHGSVWKKLPKGSTEEQVIWWGKFSWRETCWMLFFFRVMESAVEERQLRTARCASALERAASLLND